MLDSTVPFRDVPFIPVHRVATGGEHLQPRLRGERLGGGDDVLREQRLARPA